MGMVELHADTQWVGTATAPNLISNATVPNLKRTLMLVTQNTKIATSHFQEDTSQPFQDKNLDLY